jgi:transketolase
VSSAHPGSPIGRFEIGYAHYPSAKSVQRRKELPLRSLPLRQQLLDRLETPRAKLWQRCRDRWHEREGRIYPRGMSQSTRTLKTRPHVDTPPIENHVNPNAMPPLLPRGANGSPESATTAARLACVIARTSVARDSTSGSSEHTSIAQLREIARQIRVESLRAVAHAAGGHLGGPLSAADILAALYFREMNIRPSEPSWPERDRFVLSKGHSSIALYAALALRGYFPLSELATYDALNSRLQGHPDMTKLPGIDMSTGSLGVGLSAAVGLALGALRLGWPSRVYVLVGDGECQEGEVWEAADVARRYRLSNLLVIVDANGLGQFGPPGKIAGERSGPWEDGDLARRWSACGWRVLHADGHDPASLLSRLRGARRAARGPTVLIATTIKGKGVSFMENHWYWHSRVPTADELREALLELGEPA